MRADIVRIVNELSAKYPFTKYDFDVKGAYFHIFNYCRRNNLYPSALVCKVEGGILEINGRKIDRVVVSKMRMPSYNEKAAFYEERILARQETYE